MLAGKRTIWRGILAFLLLYYQCWQKSLHCLLNTKSGLWSFGFLLRCKGRNGLERKKKLDLEKASRELYETKEDQCGEKRAWMERM